MKDCEEDGPLENKNTVESDGFNDESSDSDEFQDEDDSSSETDGSVERSPGRSVERQSSAERESSAERDSSAERSPERSVERDLGGRTGNRNKVLGDIRQVWTKDKSKAILRRRMGISFDWNI